MALCSPLIVEMIPCSKCAATTLVRTTNGSGSGSIHHSRDDNDDDNDENSADAEHMAMAMKRKEEGKLTALMRSAHEEFMAAVAAGCHCIACTALARSAALVADVHTYTEWSR